MSTSNDTTVFIYVLQRISDKAYLYIGSAKNPKRRFRAHRSKNLYPSIREAFNRNDIRFLVIAYTDTVHRIEVETKFWRQFRDAGHPIVNRDPSTVRLTHGAQLFSPETRRKMSEAQKKRPPITEETRNKLLESGKGHPVTDETRAKLAMAHRGRIISQEQRVKISISGKGRVVQNETREKISKTLKGHTVTPETRQKISESNKGKTLSNETRAKISATNKGRVHTEEEKIKMREAAQKRKARKQ